MTDELKHYKVRVLAVGTIVIENALSEDDAAIIAEDAVSMGDLQMEEVRISEIVFPEDLDRSKRHADVRVDQKGRPA